jgi:hypothetical protein
MASDNKKAKADSAPKNEATAKNKTTSGEDVSKAEGRRNGCRYTGHHGLQGNWNAIYAKN